MTVNIYICHVVSCGYLLVAWYVKWPHNKP